MLFNTLILTLLSTSVTARRDKSILYSSTTIFILLFSAFIAYDNLFILFLAKGIGIFGKWYHITVITNLSIFILFLELVYYTSKYLFHPGFSWTRSLLLSSLLSLIIETVLWFFGKQMILSAAIHNEHIFMSLVVILTIVISAVYYLSILRQIFFVKPDYTLTEGLKSFNAEAITTEKNIIVEKMDIEVNQIVLSSSLSLSISVITLATSLFIFIASEILNSVTILSYIIYNI